MVKNSHHSTSFEILNSACPTPLQCMMLYDARDGLQDCYVNSACPTPLQCMMLYDARDGLQDCYVNVLIQFRTYGGVFNLYRLQAHTKVFSSVIQALLFVDDYALVVHNQDTAQQLFA